MSASVPWRGGSVESEVAAGSGYEMAPAAIGETEAAAPTAEIIPDRLSSWRRDQSLVLKRGIVS